MIERRLMSDVFRLLHSAYLNFLFIINLFVDNCIHNKEVVVHCLIALQLQ